MIILTMTDEEALKVYFTLSKVENFLSVWSQLRILLKTKFPNIDDVNPNDVINSNVHIDESMIKGMMK